MNKVDFKEIKTIVSRCGFDFNYEKNVGKKFIEVCHIHNWDYGYSENSVKWSEESTYPFYNGPRRQFYTDMKEILDFLYDYINCNNIIDFVSAPLFSNPWISCESYSEVKDIYSETTSFLRKNQMKKNSKSGIQFEIQKNKEILEMILEGGFRGVSNAYLLSQENHIILEPHHHLNIFFFTNNFEKEKKTITELLKNHQNLRYYEGIVE